MDNKEKILGRGFKALRPEIEYADDVIAPPYDVLNSEEARALAENKPFSFLHISKPEIDLPKDISADDPLVYRKGLENLESMIKKNILVRDDKESLFVYKISTKDRSQTGIAFVASIDAYENNLIKKHEHTKPAKELDRINNIKALNAQTGPVLLTYIDNSRLDNLIAEYTSGNDPIYSVVSKDKIKHTIWQIDDMNSVNDTIGAINDLCLLYTSPSPRDRG